MFKYFRNLAILSVSAFIVIAESSINTMCGTFMDEIELPEEIEDTEFWKWYIMVV